ncbi:hypothetical protein KAU43_03420 [candidate division WOR-3 bacterium]|nr:hypothetical protein [candidate division WOR-3 bacterium]
MKKTNILLFLFSLNFVLLSGEIKLKNANSEKGETSTKEIVIQKFLDRMKTVENYECIINVNTIAGRRQQKREMKIYYDKSGFVRLDILKGESKGSVAIYNPKTDKVRGHKGGLLKVIKLTLSKTDRQTTDIRGIRIDQASFVFFAERVEKFKADPMLFSVLPEEKAVITMNLKGKYRVGNADKWKLYFDINTGLIYRMEYLHGDSLVQENYYSEFKSNIEMKKNIFKI